jgi:hypothetical protein
MIGRIVDIFLLAILAWALVRALCSPVQRQSLHGLFQTVAVALLLSTLLLSALCLGGWISR